MVEITREGGLTTEEQLCDYSKDLRELDDKKTARIWSATYACTVAAMGFLVLGYSVGYNSPVSSHLKHRKGYTSLRRTLDQDLFAVSGVVLILMVSSELARWVQ